MKKTKSSVPYGYCMCGCGELAPISNTTRRERGQVRGKPVSYIRGHANRVKREYKPRFSVLDGEPVAIYVASNGREVIVDADMAARIPGAITGCRYYARCRGEGNKFTWMHSVVTGEKRVDHINGNQYDNRRSNLRVYGCHSQNLMNRGKTKANTTGFKGVEHTHKEDTWIVRVRAYNKRYYIGTFKNKEEAARAYDRAALKYHGEYARLNFPEEIEQRRRELEMEAQCESIEKTQN